MERKYTVNELIEELKNFDGNLSVDCNDGNGNYSSIVDLKEQEWTDSKGKTHKAVAIMHKGYNKDDSVVIV